MFLILPSGQEPLFGGQHTVVTCALRNAHRVLETREARCMRCASAQVCARPGIVAFRSRESSETVRG
jgi:hypothetical protein